MACLGGAKPVLGYYRVHVPQFCFSKQKISFLVVSCVRAHLRGCVILRLACWRVWSTCTASMIIGKLKQKYLFEPGPRTPQTLQVVAEAQSQPLCLRLPPMWQRFVGYEGRFSWFNWIKEILVSWDESWDITWETKKHGPWFVTFLIDQSFTDESLSTLSSCWCCWSNWAVSLS